MSECNVRVGTPLDHRAMMRFCAEMHAENGVMRLDPKRVEFAIMCGLARHRGLIGIVDGDDGEIAGSVGLFLSKWWYSEDDHLEERWLFVSSPYRRRPLARPLIEFAKRSAKGLGIPLLIGVLSNARTEAKVRLYRRQLGQPGGALFLYDARAPEHRPDLAALREPFLERVA